MNRAEVSFRRVRCRRGFTLVELLAALAISLLLISAVIASLDIYLRLTMSGEEAVERQQIARSVLSQITRDVESIVFRVEEDASDSDDADSTTTDDPAAADDEPVDVQDPETAYTSANQGLVGDSQSIVLYISRPSRELSYTTFSQATGMASRTSDLLSVSWFLASPGAGGLAGETGDLTAGASSSTRSGAGNSGESGGGLARLEGDRMAMEYANVESDVQSLAGSAELLAPEIVAVQFRYFDGADWLDAWDSTASNTLPQAIEITLGFRKSTLPDRDTLHVVSDGLEVGEFVRHVIHVPLSEPYASDSVF